MSTAIVLFRRDLRPADNPALSAACAAHARVLPVSYLRRWLPELADAPAAFLHEPWKDPSLLTRSGYPAPMVDLASSRQDALAAYKRRG